MPQPEKINFQIIRASSISPHSIEQHDANWQWTTPKSDELVDINISLVNDQKTWEKYWVMASQNCHYPLPQIDFDQHSICALFLLFGESASLIKPYRTIFSYHYFV